MAWVDKRIRQDGTKRYRLRDKINGEHVTVIKNLGFWKDPADATLVNYKKALAAGFVFTPPITIADIDNFLKAKAEGKEVTSIGRPMPIETMLDMYVEKHGPSLKGGVSQSCYSNFYLFKNKVGVLKRAWAGRLSNSITSLDVRDFFANGYIVKTKKGTVTRPYNVGGVMKYLRLITHIFKAIVEWNEEGILKPPVKLPPYNPGTMWRKKMKPAQKRELPDRRVLSEEEWHHFIPFLTERAYRICDIALRRCLRKSDIKALSELNQHNGTLKGIQAKTGDPFSVPAVDKTLVPYDFTNFQKEFKKAQVDAGMAYPKGHPLHFSLRSLRRTGATWAYREKKDLEGIRRMLGHRNVATTILYLGIEATDLIEIAEAIDRKAGTRKPRGGVPVEFSEENGISTHKACIQ